MDIDTLREIIVLADKKNYAKAAEQLYISQSALSRHISAFEAKYKVQLFERSPRQVRLTAYGKALIPFARKIIELEDESLYVLEHVRHAEQKSIRIGTIHGLSNYGIMEKIAGFIAANRDLSIQLIYNEAANLKEMLAEGNADIIIISEEADKDTVKTRNLTLFEDQLAVILPKEHPLSAKKELSFKELSQEEWILQEDNRFISGMIRDLTRGSGVEVRKSDVHVAGVGAIELVKQGIGIALEQMQVAQGHPDSGLVYIPVSPAKKVRICMKWTKNVSPACERFIDFMKKHRK